MISSGQEGIVFEGADVNEGILGFFATIDALKDTNKSVIGHMRAEQNRGAYHRGNGGFEDGFFAKENDLVNERFEFGGGNDFLLDVHKGGGAITTMADSDSVQLSIPLRLSLDDIPCRLS